MEVQIRLNTELLNENVLEAIKKMFQCKEVIIAIRAINDQQENLLAIKMYTHKLNFRIYAFFISLLS